METDVVVIGGGATGLGVAWDLTLRGLRVTLVEMGDVATGTSGRYHGQLHTGARYVVSDLKSARECWQEHTTIRKVAPHVLDDTGGMFVLSPSDDEGYVDEWLEGCEATGIPVQELTTSEALRSEPLVHPKIGRAFRVLDASCDSFALCGALRRSAESEGATFLTYHRVDGFHQEDGRVSGLRTTDLRTGETEDVRASFVVNAAGPWAAEVGKKAGVEFRMVLSRGAMFAFNGRWTTAIVSRLRPPGDGDIFVPLGYLGVAGTTSVPTEDPDDIRIEDWEWERVLAEVEAFLPGIRRGKILRAWAGVRPLYDPATQSSSAEGTHVDNRKATRTFDVLDHAARVGVEGIVSIVGGKLTTFRLMAERTADAVCSKLGVVQPCTTATTEIAPAHARGARGGFPDERGGILGNPRRLPSAPTAGGGLVSQSPAKGGAMS
jgi:glycerol-3-phosphate dehydrogenase